MIWPRTKTGLPSGNVPRGSSRSMVSTVCGVSLTSQRFPESGKLETPVTTRPVDGLHLDFELPHGCGMGDSRHKNTMANRYLCVSQRHHDASRS